MQDRGPETGLHERAGQPAICAYYANVLADRMLGSGRVEFFPGATYVGDRTVVSRVSGRAVRGARSDCRIVDARYLAPDIPAELPPKFAVGDGARVVPVNDLVHLEEAPSQYVVVGSGKTATDACIWLLARGVDPDAICWVRPRDPWMLNRALIQPDPVIYLGMVAARCWTPPGPLRRWTTCSSASRTPGSCCASTARSPRRWPSRPPSPPGSSTCSARIENVVRLGHIRSVTRGRLDLRGWRRSRSPTTPWS